MMVQEPEMAIDRLARLHREIQLAGHAYLAEVADSSSREAAEAICEALSDVLYILHGVQDAAVTKRDYLIRTAQAHG